MSALIRGSIYLRLDMIINVKSISHIVRNIRVNFGNTTLVAIANNINVHVNVLS